MTAEELTAMTLAQLVDRGEVLVDEIHKRQKELKLVEAEIKARAQARPEEHVPLKDDSREGRKFVAPGSRRHVPVVFTADKLVGSFQKDSKEHKRISEFLASSPELAKEFATFFRPWNGYENRYKDGKDFRKKADEVFGKDAPGFISACLARDKDQLPKSDIRIDWKQADEAEQKEAA